MIDRHSKSAIFESVNAGTAWNWTILSHLLSSTSVIKGKVCILMVEHMLRVQKGPGSNSGMFR